MNRSIIAALLVALSVVSLMYTNTLSRLTTASETIATLETERAAATAEVLRLEREQQVKLAAADKTMLEWRKRYEQELDEYADNLTLTTDALTRLREQTTSGNTRCDAVQADNPTSVDDGEAAARARIDEETQRIIINAETMYRQCAHALRAFQITYGVQ